MRLRRSGSQKLAKRLGWSSLPCQVHSKLTKKQLAQPSELEEKLKDLEDKAFDRHTTAAARRGLNTRMGKVEGQLEDLRTQEKQIISRMRARQRDSTDASGSALHQPRETERERLIRTGKITPFAKVSGLERVQNSASSFSHQDFVGQPNVDIFTPRNVSDQVKREEESEDDYISPHEPSTSRKRKRKVEPNDDDEYIDAEDETDEDMDDQGLEDEVAVNDDDYSDAETATAQKAHRKTRYEDKHVDDGDELVYQIRLARWARKRRLQRLKYAVGEPCLFFGCARLGCYLEVLNLQLYV